jgi:glycosyltransferase involved in cell wall biosynthesis
MRKRILVLIKGLGRGGAEQLIANAIPYLDRERFEYIVAYLLPHKDAHADQLREAGISLVCLGSVGTSSLRWTASLRSLVSRCSIDLVHAHLPYTGIVARIATIGLPIPIVYTEHNVWEMYRRDTYWGNALTFPLNDRVIAVSQTVGRSIRYPKALEPFLPYPPMEAIYHGPDLEAIADSTDECGVRREFGIPDGALVVGSVGNLRPEKGHRYMLEAAALVVRETSRDVRFLIVGGGAAEAGLRRMASAHGLSAHVVFAGSRPDAIRIASAFDLFCLASVHEGLAIALVEAMALGKPSVVTAVGGVPEVVEHGEEGLVVRPRDPGALASALLTLLEDDALRAEMGRAAKKRAEAFDIRKAVRRTEEIYRELLGL